MELSLVFSIPILQLHLIVSILLLPLLLYKVYKALAGGWLPFSLVQNIILQSLYACHDLGGVGKAQKDGEGERTDQDNDCERLGGLGSFGGRLSCLLFNVISCSSVSEYCL